jgi:hypothetical protein
MLVEQPMLASEQNCTPSLPDFERFRSPREGIASSPVSTALHGRLTQKSRAPLGVLVRPGEARSATIGPTSTISVLPFGNTPCPFTALLGYMV